MGENMVRMFKGAKAFDQPLKTWETKLVTDMHEMFLNAETFNQELTPGTSPVWDTSAVKDMNAMFQGAKAFNNGDTDTIKNWDTTALTKTSNMSNGAVAFNQPIPTSRSK